MVEAAHPLLNTLRTLAPRMQHVCFAFLGTPAGECVWVRAALGHICNFSSGQQCDCLVLANHRFWSVRFAISP